MTHRNKTGFRSSVFWRVSLVLIVVQLATGFLAAGFTVWFASDRSGDLAESSLKMRLDAVAEEIERSSVGQALELEKLPEMLKLNLALRFPDPVLLVDPTGQVVETVYPSEDAFPGGADSTLVPDIPDDVVASIGTGNIIVDRTDTNLPGGWALAPLYDAGGFPIGALIVQPVERSMAQELEPTLDAFRSAMWIIAAIGFILAVALGAGFTWWLVRPLRRMTDRVDQIGEGDLDARVRIEGKSEIARLGRTINEMANRVSESIEALKTTDRIRRELVANVGHDLRTPLAALRGHVEEGHRYLDENRPADAQRSLISARKQADHLDDLVADLFELSQLENPEPTLRLEPVPVAEWLHDAVRANISQMNDAGIELTLRLEPDLPIISGDGVRLLRAMNNLLANAVRHTPSGGCIELSATAEENRIQIDVRDTGEGMSEDVLEHIFERYYRGQTSRTRTGGGTGLGLAISRAVALGHGGSLEATSTPGAGTTMTLCLPVRDGP